MYEGERMLRTSLVIGGMWLFATERILAVKRKEDMDTNSGPTWHGCHT
jgi:hypothetical protein